MVVYSVVWLIFELRVYEVYSSHWPRVLPEYQHSVYLALPGHLCLIDIMINMLARFVLVKLRIYMRCLARPASMSCIWSPRSPTTCVVSPISPVGLHYPFSAVSQCNMVLSVEMGSIM